MKSTAVANSNIAFIKYWGRKDEILRLPTNGSVSMTLDNLSTTTTVEFSEKYLKDIFNIDDEKIENPKLVKHLDRIRKIANIDLKAKVVSKNNFPASTGLSSSASGYSALTVAACSALNLKLSKKELSILSRQGSGSSCRSMYSGYVEWLDSDKSEESYSVQLYDEKYWDLIDIVCVVSKEKKLVPTSIGQTYAQTSPFFQTRLDYIKNRIKNCKKYIQEKNFSELGKLIEQEALDLHCIMLSSYPHLIYWSTGTLKLMKLVQEWRKEHIEVYFTVNTGQNIHLICENKNKEKVMDKLNNLDFVKKTIVNHAGQEPKIITEHLF